jgi:hypothetical protein
LPEGCSRSQAGEMESAAAARTEASMRRPDQRAMTPL